MKNLLIILILLFSLTSLPCNSQIVLNEIMFDPLFSDGTDEFIEILNLSENESVDLNGWQISDSHSSDSLISTENSMILNPCHFAVILDSDYFQNSATYDNLIPDQALILTINSSTIGSRGLSNSSPETIQLIDNNNKIVAQYTYSTGNNPGFSDEKINPRETDNINNWAESCIIHGTPGKKNSVYADNSSGKISIEVIPNPFSPDQDGFNDIAEITLYTPWASAMVNLTIFDIRGRHIKTLLSSALSGPQKTVIWDGSTSDNKFASTGIYIIFFEAINNPSGSILTSKTTIVLAGGK